MSDTVNVFAPEDADTARIGAVVARHLRPGDLVLFEGDLGAGKSALARAIIRTRLDAPDLDVPSPTFLLVLPYANGREQMMHADLYRLSHPDEIEELGLFDDAAAMVLVEWPERAPDLADRADWRIFLAMPPGGEGRHMKIASPRDGARLARLAPDLSHWV